MRRLTALGFLLLGSIAIGPFSLAAQEHLDSASVAQLKPDRFVRIQVPDLGRVSGRVNALTPNKLTLVTADRDRRVSLAAIDTLWVRGRRTKTGAIIGSIVGLGGGIFLGLLVDGLCEYDCGNGAPVTLGILGAAAGAGAGALIGAAIPRWRKIFPR